jgi:(p)ppGpp synthase/HD superfamily hydrolase
MSMIDEAIVFAAQAHGAIEHRRKGSDLPYIAHPIEVMAIVSTVPDHTEAMLAAAVLHDVVEDTDIGLEEIKDRFGIEVMTLVAWLTDVSTKEDGNREARRAVDREHSGQAPAEAQTVKLADLISNTKNIVEHDPGFARIYLREKRLLLDVLDKGDRRLWWQAMGHCMAGFEKLEMAW